MSKADEYTANALASLELAERVSNPDDEQRLLKLAEAWLDLADRAIKRGAKRTRKLTDHPLINAKLGDKDTELA